MSRSGYIDDCSGWDLIRWRGAVASAIRGKRGQAFLREMLAALDSLPEKRLISHELVSLKGEYCAMGAVMKSRGMFKISNINPHNRGIISSLLQIAPALVAELAFINDADFRYIPETPEQRYCRVRLWIEEHLAS